MTKLADLDPTQIKRLAALAQCSPGALRHVQAGRRNMSAEMAIRVERAATRMRLDLRREDMNAGCEKCEFAKACRKLSTT
jgi:plasmid maintenance system antidote protein VapI